MELHLWLAFVGVITVLVAIPGPSALISITHGLRYGRGRAASTVPGGVTAALVLMSLSALGLGTVLAASTTAFMILKIVGALYLIWLGIASWRSAAAAHTPEHVHMDASHTRVALFRKGFLVGISNPKDLLFFAALFPNVISTTEPHALQFAILALTCVLFDFSIMFFYASTGRHLSGVFSNPCRIALLNRATGGVFVLAGSALAISSR